MTLSNGQSYLAIPGPSVIPERVLRAMHRASPNIYQGELVDLTHSLIPDLKSVAGTAHHAAIYIANGHGVWEAALSNVVKPGETVLVLATGRFCEGWGEMATALGIHIETIDFGNAAAVDMTQVEAVLKADTDQRIKAVMAVHVDTSTGVRNDIVALRNTIDTAGHKALLMVDCIASLGCDEFQMDAWGVDVMVAACQKGLMTPAGVGFVFFGPRAVEARDAMPRVSRYWDWTLRTEPEVFYQYFCGTAPTHHLYGLRAALDMINAETLPAIYNRHRVLAQCVWAAVDAWATAGTMRLNIDDPTKRSHAVTSVVITPPNSERLQTWTRENIGLTLGLGLGMDPVDGYFRIGHMGHVNGQMILAALGGIDAGLKAIGVPHGAGAIEAAATVIAKAAPFQETDGNNCKTGCCGG